MFYDVLPAVNTVLLSYNLEPLNIEYVNGLHVRRLEILHSIAACIEGFNSFKPCVIAVSKTVGVEQIIAAYLVGYRDFGENRVVALAEKTHVVTQIIDTLNAQQLLAEKLDYPRFHMIGTLQENKINKLIAAKPYLVHSVSSVKLAQALEKRCAREGQHLNVLLELNLSHEDSKTGMNPNEYQEALQVCNALSCLQLKGLMTMAAAHNVTAAHDTFSTLTQLKNQAVSQGYLPKHAYLSMGMSQDYPVALVYGATHVRLGRVVFDLDMQLPVL